MNHYRKQLALLVLTSVLLSACGDKKSTTPAAVKVNGMAISTAELDEQAKQFSHPNGAQQSAITARLLKKMVDMEILRQAAVKDKLDADESVRQKLLVSNRLILANAYMEKQLAAVAKPSANDVKQYFDQHPELFSARKVYSLKELIVQITPNNTAEIKAKLGDGKHFDEFVQWLTEKKIPSATQPYSLAAEQVPEPVMQQLKNAKVGDAFSQTVNGRLIVIYVAAAEPQPTTLAQSSAMIENAILGKRKNEKLGSIMKDLQEKAKVEYIPPYTAQGKAETDQ